MAQVNKRTSPCCLHSACQKRDWTLKYQLCATISSSSGLMNKAQLKFLTSSTKQIMQTIQVKLAILIFNATN